MNLLIVDDEWISVQGLLMGVHWNDCGITKVFEAYSALEAKKVLEENEIQIILCDIEMPGESGVELVRWIRNHYDKVECLFLTCHADFKYAKEAIRLGCGEYLVKPAPFSEVEEAIKKMADKVQKEEINNQLINCGKHFIEEKKKYAESQYGKRINSTEIMDIVEQYVLDHLNQNILVEEIARIVALHPDYLSRLVKKEKGVSINRYIIERKMKIAACMLEETDLSANIIANEIGYVNYPNFVKTFKKIYEISPRKYREDIKKIKTEKNNR